MAGTPLSDPRRERFCNEYLADTVPNAAKAATRAGYQPKAAHVTASRLLKNAKVTARIAELQKQSCKRLKVSRAWVIRRLRREAIKRGEGASHAARVKALELLGRHRGMWPREVKHSGQVGVNVTTPDGGDLARKVLAAADRGLDAVDSLLNSLGKAESRSDQPAGPGDGRDVRKLPSGPASSAAKPKPARPRRAKA